ncbi:MAG: class I SAM-dependent methyltransferase [bacterium]
MPFTFSEPIRVFYEKYDEANRLTTGAFQLELARTQDILRRHLPAPPAVIFDIGGGPGVYSCWLAQLGYQVHLLDPVPSHIAQAKQLAAQRNAPVASMTIGDARQLDFADNSADIVLMLGPLYHLLEPKDRRAALQEAHRVLRQGGSLFAAVISRFASALDGLFQGLLDDPQFAQIVERDLRDGKHLNPTNNIIYFTESYFHRVEELAEEIKAAGFHYEKTLAIEGPGGWLQNFDAWWNEPARRKRLLDLMKKLENEPSLIGVSAHVMGIARKP